MKTDVVILGSELDALVAALRLHELGHSVRRVVSGAGSLHLAPAGIRVLGFTSDTDREARPSPLDAIEELAERHPYRLAGARTGTAALDWFFETTLSMGLDFRRNGTNKMALTPSGLPTPVYAPTARQATQDATDLERVSVVRFRGHRDFSAAMFASALARSGSLASVIEVDGPSQRTDTVSLAREFDAMGDADAYFGALKSRLPAGTGALVFPAVLGLRRHQPVIEAAEHRLGVRCLEVSTLPPSVPGMRLLMAIETRLREAHIPVHTGVRCAGRRAANQRCEAIVDRMGRVIEGSVFVVATGGVLMGGLQVQSDGQIREANLGLEVFQTGPLAAERIDESLDALHRAGVETDSHLRPTDNGSVQFENVFISGRTLAHWNPATEASADGVSIVTGWLAAQSACDYLRG